MNQTGKMVVVKSRTLLAGLSKGWDAGRSVVAFPSSDEEPLWSRVTAG